jgi:hypothetical protein
MSARYITVVFKDSADGYEFPVASYLVNATDTVVVADARRFADDAIKSGDFRPEGYLVLDRIER